MSLQNKFRINTFLIGVFLIVALSVNAQKAHVSYYPIVSSAYIDSLKTTYGNLKSLPRGYELQALLALSHYPELQNVKIKFRAKKGGAPFVSRPTVWSTFFRGKKKRTYLILIRERDDPMFSPILLKNMPFNAQIGVFGHELAHTQDFYHRGFFKMLNVVFGNFSQEYLDNFEFETDRRAIQFGLGFQLLTWSEHAIKTLRFNEPAPSAEKEKKVGGMIERERYMRPETIRKEMRKYEMYQIANRLN